MAQRSGSFIVFLIFAVFAGLSFRPDWAQAVQANQPAPEMMRK
jgi:hypothetical protein